MTTLYLPTITSFTPSHGPVGTAVTITGTNLLNSTGANAVEVYYGNVFANSPKPAVVVTPSVNNATTVTFAVPAKAATAFMGVVTDIGAAESATQFVVDPGVTSFSPHAGHVGDYVTIVGTDLENSTVTVDGIAALVVLNYYDMLVIKVPVGAVAGVIAVTTVKNNVSTLNTLSPVITIS